MTFIVDHLNVGADVFWSEDYVFIFTSLIIFKKSHSVRIDFYPHRKFKFRIPVDIIPVRYLSM